MKTYANYAFYVEKYGGQMISEDYFKSAIIGASQYIRYITLNRSDLYEGDEIKYAACAVADVYYSTIIAGQAGTDRKFGKKSESIDGYSVTYVSDRADGETCEDVFRKKAFAVANQWLLPTGILHRGVMRRC